MNYDMCFRYDFIFYDEGVDYFDYIYLHVTSYCWMDRRGFITACTSSCLGGPVRNLNSIICTSTFRPDSGASSSLNSICS